MTTLNLNKKISMLILGTVLFITLPLIIVTTIHTQKLLAASQQKLAQSAVTTAYTLIESFYKNFQNGQVSEDEAQMLAQKKIAELKFGDNQNYNYWIATYDSKLLVYNNQIHQKTSTTDYVAPNGEQYLTKAAKQAIASDNTYVTHKLKNNSQILDAVTYATTFTKWKWVIGTTITADGASLLSYIKLTALLLISLLAITLLLLQRLAHKYVIANIKLAAQNADSILTGNLNDISVPTTMDESADICHKLRKIADTINKLQHETWASEQRAKKLQDAPVAIIDLDTSLNIHAINQKASRWCGFSPQHSLEKKYTEIFKLADNHAPEWSIQRCMQQKEIYTKETILYRQNEKVPITYTVIPVFNRMGQLKGCTIYMIDLSAPYQAAKALQASAKTLTNMVSPLAKAADNLNLNSKELSTQSNHVSSATKLINSNILNVAKEAEASSGNISQMASGAEEMYSSISSIATAVEELNASFSEISNHTVGAAKIANQASQQSDLVSQTMNALNNAANNIGKIVRIISEIADQTNMLALNAAIEAASAGEAGKGFAVVASEVKELAKQTTDSTEEISNQIEAIQKSTTDATDKIKTVVEIVNKICEQNQQIAVAVEQQTATAKEISKTIAETSKTSKELAAYAERTNSGMRKVAESSQKEADEVREILASIQRIDTTGSLLDRNSQNVKGTTDKLVHEVNQLNTLLNNFTLLDQI